MLSISLRKEALQEASSSPGVTRSNLATTAQSTLTELRSQSVWRLKMFMGLKIMSRGETGSGHQGLSALAYSQCPGSTILICISQRNALLWIKGFGCQSWNNSYLLVFTGSGFCISYFSSLVPSRLDQKLTAPARLVSGRWGLKSSMVLHWIL
jgi:hypothetical protein